MGPGIERHYSRQYGYAIELLNDYSDNKIVYNIHASHKHLQRVAIIYILTLAQFPEIRIERHHRVCRTEVQRVVYAPVDLDTREIGERLGWMQMID